MAVENGRYARKKIYEMAKTGEKERRERGGGLYEPKCATNSARPCPNALTLPNPRCMTMPPEGKSAASWRRTGRGGRSLP